MYNSEKEIITQKPGKANGQPGLKTASFQSNQGKSPAGVDYLGVNICAAIFMPAVCISRCVAWNC